MVGLPALGELSYNGYTFDGTAKITCDVEFEYDQSGRAVLFHRNYIRVEAEVCATGASAGTPYTLSLDSTDSQIANIRARLSKPGKALRFVNKGFGEDLIVNQGSLTDVEFGPKPRILRWKPIAGTGSAKIIWEVEVCVPVCDGSGVHRTTGVMSFNYGVSFQIDGGWTTRTIKGSLRIAQTRSNGDPPRAPDTADNYREYIKAGDVAPDGFERKSTWDTSEDKSTLTFTITDEQIRSDNIYPPGVRKIEARQRSKWSRGNKSARKLFCRLNVSIELIQGIPVINGYRAFSSILLQRMSYAGQMGAPVFLEDIDIEEDLYGVQHSYSAGWRIIRGLDDIIRGTGLFTTPIVNSRSWRDWNRYAKSSQRQRGYLGMREFAANDVIVDMCTNQLPATSEEPYRAPSPGSYGNQPIYNKVPPPEKSYLGFENSIQIDKAMPVTRQSPTQYPYGGQSALAGAIGIATGGGFQGSIIPPQTPTQPTAANGMTFDAQEKKQYDDTIQMSGGSNCIATMTGTAERVGYEIPRPRIVQIGDLSVATGKVVETSIHFVQRCKGIYFGVPLFQAAWQINYMLTNTPSFMKTPNNIEESGESSQWIT